MGVPTEFPSDSDPDPDKVDQEAEPNFELQFTPEESEAI